MIDQHVHLSFRDVLLVPYDVKPCAVMSRNDPDISTSISKNVTIKVPILSAPMDTVTDSDMCIALDQCGALGIHTRYINNDQERSLQIESINKMKQHGVKNIAMAIGVHNAYDNAAALVNAGTNIICVDIANGNHVLMLKALKELDRLKQQYAYLSIIAGNVASGPAALRLAEAGASAVKVGIGCFVGGSKVKTDGGYKSIDDIVVGDKVISHKNVPRRVTRTFKRSESEKIVSINGIKCTKNHKFYVVNRKFKDTINDDNLHDYAEWIEAKDLTKEYLLIKIKE